MKQLLIILSLAMMANFALAQTSNLSIKVKGIEEVKGDMCIALYANEEDYKDSKNQVFGECIPVKLADFEYVIKDLPQGIYMVSLFHDIDSNEELNTNWIGMPKEPFGFSNDAKGKMGPPKFEDASFELKDDMETTINLMTL